MKKLDVLYKAIMVVAMLYVVLSVYKGIKHPTDSIIRNIHSNTEIRNHLLEEQNQLLLQVVEEIRNIEVEIIIE